MEPINFIKKFNVLFICTGNICRSPAAHAIFKKLITDKKEERIIVDSAGMASSHKGEEPDIRMIEILEEQGISFTHQSQPFDKSFGEKFDLILAMDEINYRDLSHALSADILQKKVRMFRDFDPSGKGSVPDPYFGSTDGFEFVYWMIYRTCEALLDKIITYLDREYKEEEFLT